VAIRNVTDRKIVREGAILILVVAGGLWLPTKIWGWSVPASQVVYGIILGSLTALTAIGLALVYRANKVINFAQADIGAVPAALCISLVSIAAIGWSFWIAVPVSLIAAVALGSLIELVIIRRFSKAPRLILMVVTIGLAQLLASLAATLQFFLGAQAPLTSPLPIPLDFTYNLNGTLFHANALLTVIFTLAAVVGLFVFMRYTNIGIALRASSESADRAGMLGVNVGFTQNVAWMIAAFLSALALIMRATLVGLPFGPALGPSLLLRALTAAVIARMERFWIMFIAGCGLGVVETVVLWNRGEPTLVDPVIFFIVVGALLFQRRHKESRVEDQAVSSWQNAANVRPVPRELAALPEVKWVLRGLRIAFVVFLVALPFFLGLRDTNLAAAVAIYSIIAISLVLLTGWAGEISLGQVAFVAIGAAAASAANVRWNLDPLLTFLLAAAVGAVASVIIGLPALRIRGLMLAVTTLAFAVATPSFLLNRQQSLAGISFDYLPDPALDTVRRLPIWTPFGNIDISSERQFYFVCIAGLFVVLLATRGLIHSRVQRDIVAVRENERNAQVFLLTPARTKLLAFALSGFFASFAGGLLALHQQALGVAIFAPAESIRVLSMVVVGGLGSVPGAILGAIFIKSTEWFQDIVPTNYQFLFQYAGSGIGLILVLWLLPGGLGSLLYRVRDHWLRRVAAKHEMVVPSLIADTDAEPTLLTGERAAPAVARGEVEREFRGPKWMKHLRHRPMPTVDYFSFPDLALSGGRPNLLSLRSVDVAYGQVQVLFGVNLELREGETIALLGTNGAGKSTVLRAISGLVTPNHGTISHNGVDISGMAPHLIARKGVIQVPGGRGVFPSLSVEENLKVAVWLYRRDSEYVNRATEEALDLFPILRTRLNEPAASLSGGQQQMLALAMAFLAKPQLLMIDELSLGLAPLVVEQLLAVVKRFRDRGTSVVLVEQSVNVALTTADKAFFMEKGAIRFHGLTSELLERPDLLRSIFLEGAASATGEKSKAREQEEAAAHRERIVEQTGALDAFAAPAVGANDSGGSRSPVVERRVVLETCDITKRFSGIMAVDHVSIQLHEGEILGIIGPNGAGKTTLFDLISGFIAPDEGHIFLEGRDITKARPQRRAALGLTRSFQDSRLFGALTVHQVICVALDRPLRIFDPIPAMFSIPALTSERRLSRRADELIAVMGLDDYRDKFVSDLSTGSRRIVDLACQIGISPKVILFDEPSSAIAQRETEALGPLILRIRDITGASILVIEHDMPLITSVSDRIVACDLGQIVVDGDADSVLTHPQVVGSYLGSTREVIERSGRTARVPEPTGEARNYGPS
jgi:ABC-type branched-subunit amino acid transport system ATPase component/ABC-type branched-subunit amino acid transport system permease subunit